MSDFARNNRRVVKNTVFLYVRMMFTMVIGFFSTRLVLQFLGAENYGLANVVGSAVLMFGFIMATMQTATLRFYTFELGRGDIRALKEVVGTSLLIFVLLALLAGLLLETVGLWVLETKIIIPTGREAAAFWFFQFMALAFCLNILTVPFSALTIAHEDMGLFAVISIGEAVLRLAMLFLLKLGLCDSLALYGGILAAVSVARLMAFAVMCVRRYPEGSLVLLWRRVLFFRILSFSGWNLWGAIAGILAGSWVNILLNNYCGAVVNAGKAIATQINTMTSQFANNFLMSVNPQIVKYHAQDELVQRDKLVARASKIGFSLYLLVAVPAIAEMDSLLHLWLGDFPPFTPLFARLALVQLGIDIISYPLMTLAQATGRIAVYQSVIGGLLCLNFPLSWAALHFGGPPQSVFWVAIAISLLACVLRLVILRRIAGFPVWSFAGQVIARLALVAALIGLIVRAVPLPFAPGLLRVLVTTGICLPVSAGCIYFVGMDSVERRRFVEYVRSRLTARKTVTP